MSTVGRIAFNRCRICGETDSSGHDCWSKQSTTFPLDTSQACMCIGPQNGEPYCPCKMRSRGVYKRDGRWVEPERDLGPIPPGGE